MVYGKMMVHLDDTFEHEKERKDWQFLSQDETDDETLLRRVVRDAVECQLKYRACGQTVLYPMALHLGLATRETVTAMTTLTGGFGGEEICCALVGGIAALGLEFGRLDFTERGGPRSRGHSTFTLAQAFSGEARQRFVERTGGLIRCGDLCDRHFGKRLAPPDRNKPVELNRIKSGEIFGMLSTYACKMVELAAEVCTEIILRERRKRGIVTPLMGLPWYNRTWEVKRMTELQTPVVEDQ